MPLPITLPYVQPLPLIPLIDYAANGNFASGHGSIPVGGYQSFGNLSGWTTVVGSAPLEVVRDGYFGISGTGPADTGYWLDTQASPGGIDIKQTMQIQGATNVFIHDKIQFDISDENIGGTKTANDHHFHVVWNNAVVADITPAQLGDYNTFHHFDLDVAGLSGANTLEIRDVGGTPNNVGFAVTNIHVVQTFETFPGGVGFTPFHV